ncbi:MAG TPA: hypothetical protein VMG98_08190 [Verrucomicrobiae bacterium]|nr:hypothetical protein [Verrucomicrobiae bacterium]HTZ54661.1 hypothetical protein [Candidatus Acidoferrum sp.]
MTGYRVARFVTTLAVCILVAGAAADATLDTVIAQRVTVSDKPVTDCVARARAALTSVLQSANETDPGSGEWVGVAQVSGSIAAAVVIECHPVDAGGYSASFTCSVQTPTYADTASGLCGKLTAAFNTAAAPATTQGGAL